MNQIHISRHTGNQVCVQCNIGRGASMGRPTLQGLAAYLIKNKSALYFTSSKQIEIVVDKLYDHSLTVVLEQLLLLKRIFSLDILTASPNHSHRTAKLLKSRGPNALPVTIHVRYKGSYTIFAYLDPSTHTVEWAYRSYLGEHHGTISNISSNTIPNYLKASIIRTESLRNNGKYPNTTFPDPTIQVVDKLSIINKLK